MTKKIVFSILMTFSCLMIYNISQAEQQATTKTLEALTAEWVDLKQQLEEEKRIWKLEHAHLNQMITLLTKEKQILKTDIHNMEKKKRSKRSLKAKLVNDKKQYETLLTAALPVVARAEQALLLWPQKLPQSLLEPMKHDFARLKTGYRKSLSQRLQLVIQLYSRIDQLDHLIHVGKEVLQLPSGESREFDVLYIGLTQGFCVSRDNKLAGIGRPERLQWNWSWHPELTGKIRLALEYANHEKISDFVQVPIQINH